VFCWFKLEKDMRFWLIVKHLHIKQQTYFNMIAGGKYINFDEIANVCKHLYNVKKQNPLWIKWNSTF
jgi:hypothetical protein